MSTSSTTNKQRIGIWLIAALMALGTVGSLSMVVLANENAGKDQARLQKMMNEYSEKIDEHNAKMSKIYFPLFSPYREDVAPFDADVKELDVEVLKEGDGKEIGEDEEFYVYYLGWLPDGKVFDSSFEEKDDDVNKATELKGPFPVEPDGGVIEGWKEGLTDLVIGDVIQLTIPAEKAYGETGSGEIPANTPLRFIVMVIDNSSQPPIPSELSKLYERIGEY